MQQNHASLLYHQQAKKSNQNLSHMYDNGRIISCTCFCSPALQSAASAAYWHQSWNWDLLEDIVAEKQNYHKTVLKTRWGEQKLNTNSYRVWPQRAVMMLRWRLIMFQHKQEPQRRFIPSIYNKQWQRNLLLLLHNKRVQLAKPAGRFLFWSMYVSPSLPFFFTKMCLQNIFFSISWRGLCLNF